MRRRIPIRLLVCAVLAGSASLAAVAIPGGIASATALTVSCKTMTGTGASVTSSDTLHFSVCSGTGSSETKTTGTGVVVTNHKQPSGSGTDTVTWASKEKSVVSFTYTETSNPTTVKKDCKAVTGDTAVAYVTDTGSVIAKGTTTTKMVGGKTSGKSCVYLTKTHSVYEVGIGSQVF